MDNSFQFPRKFKRKELSAKVGFLSNGRYHFAEAVTISEGGMLIQTHQTVDLEEILEVDFYIPQQHFIKAKGQVLYVTKSSPGSVVFAIGVLFLDLMPADRQAIKRYTQS